MLLNAWVVLIFVAYFAVLLGIALVRARRMQGMADYVLGSRQLSAFASALSASSSSASGGSMLAAPALVYIEGGMVVWIFLIIWVATLLSWVVLAGRLRRYTVAAGDSLTIPAFLENRFEDRTGGLRTISAVVSLFFITIYIASGLVGGAKLLETTLGMDPVFGILVTLVAVASYTFIGGFMAVSRTDVFQALLMLGAFMVVSLTLLGVTENPLGELLAGEGAYLNPFNDAEGNSLSWVFILSVAGWGVPAWGSLRVLQRFMAVESESKIPASRNIAIAWSALISGCTLLLGWMERPALEQAGMLSAIADPERIFFAVAGAFFHPLVGGLLLTGVVAAVMSTADSQLLLA